MLSHDRLARFAQMERDDALLRGQFAMLTSAHGYFHGPGALRAISVSDPRDDGSIEALFLDVRIRFQMVMIFNDSFAPRARVICMHCHGAYGFPHQARLGAFTFDADGVTDLDAGSGGAQVTLRGGAPHIVLTFLDRALAANRCL